MALVTALCRMNIAHVLLVMAAMGLLACHSPSPSDPPPPPEVAVVALATEPVTMTAEFLAGRWRSWSRRCGRRSDGIIQRRLFTEGQQVKSGQVLYQIDPALYQADYDSAAATLARAEAARMLGEAAGRALR